MTGSMRKHMTSASASDGDRRFPPEAFKYHDDVGPDAVAVMRKKASKIMATDEWEVVDGFGLANPA